MLIDQFAGLRNDIPADRFDVGDLAVAENIVLDDSFKINRRPGNTLLVPGAKHSLWSSGDICLYVAGNTLFRLFPDLTADVVTTGLTVDARMSYTTHGERIYFANGFERGAIDNDGARDWGIEVPPLPEASATTGSLDAGTYQYTATYLSADGQESGAGPSGTIDLVDDSGIDMVFAPLPSGVMARVLYLSNANGEVLFEAQIVTGLAATVTTFNDVAALETLNLCPPPEGVKLVAEYFGHILCSVGSVLYYSQTYGPEHFDLRDYLVFDTEITMIAPTDEGVFIGTENQVIFMSGRSPEEFTLSYPAEYGVFRGSLAYLQAHLLGFEGIGESLAAMWMTEQGICVGLSGGAFYNLTDPRYQSAVASREMAAVVQKINGSTYYTAST